MDACDRDSGEGLGMRSGKGVRTQRCRRCGTEKPFTGRSSTSFPPLCGSCSPQPRSIRWSQLVVRNQFLRDQ